MTSVSTQPTPEEKQKQALEAKQKGNFAWTHGRFDEAVQLYSEAISLDPKPEFYRNRSASYLRLKDYDKALEDAETAVGLDPESKQGYCRKAEVYFRLGIINRDSSSFQKALECFEIAYKKSSDESFVQYIEETAYYKTWFKCFSSSKVEPPPKRPKPEVVFVLGGPGSGKGTQSEKIVSEYGYVHLSAGELLREERKKGTEHGEIIEDRIRNGQIVPSDITVQLLDNAMKSSSSNKFLIDGFPRNKENNDTWNRMMESKVNVKFVLFFDCPEEVMEKRLLKRGEDSGRSDDNIETIKKRFQTFCEHTIPVIQLYAQQNKVEKIDSNRDPESVWKDVQLAFQRHS